MFGHRIGLVAVAATAMVAGVNLASPTQAADSNAPVLRLLQLDRPLVIAHRGYSALAPDQVLGALGPPAKHADGRKVAPAERFLSAAWLDAARDTGARLMVWNDQVTREAVALTHQRGQKVWIYTIDDGEAAGRLFDLGVDGIISNNPPVIWKALATRRR